MVDLREVVAAVQFTPSNAQIRHRNAFWAKPGTQVPPECTLNQAIELAPSVAASRCLERNWNIPGFADWFLSPQWEQEETQRLLHLGMRRVSEILINSSDPDTLLKAAKEARELHTKMTQASEKTAKFADAGIQEMTPEELREFIRRNTASISK